MAKVHEYVLWLPDGKYQVTKTNGPNRRTTVQAAGWRSCRVLRSPAREGFTAQINEESCQAEPSPHATFEGVAGNVLIGRSQWPRICGG